MSAYHLAQLNIARSRAGLELPSMAGFVDRLDEINALAESSPGFVWRLKDESGDATHIRAFHDPLVIVNLTVWETGDDLFAFVYRTRHVEVFQRRRDWFHDLPGPHLVCWWIPAGTVPTIGEAKRRLELLGREGPVPDAFTLRVRFPPPTGAPQAAIASAASPSSRRP